MNQVKNLISFVLSEFYLGSYVELELKKFAERRTDIFGMGAQETVIGRKVNTAGFYPFQFNSVF